MLGATLDALILLRCRDRLAEFWGPDQAGGSFEALASVLAVVLLAQLRNALALPLILVFVDLATAFDVADRDDMRVAAFAAGIPGRLWLLLDDLLSMDHCRVHFGDLQSDVFKLSCGTAQGRRLSIHLFNGQMRFFAGRGRCSQPRCGCLGFPLASLGFGVLL